MFSVIKKNKDGNWDVIEWFETEKEAQEYINQQKEKDKYEILEW